MNNKVNVRTVFNKAIRNVENLTNEEKEVLNFDNGALVVPKEIKSELLDGKRPSKSMKSLVDVIPVTYEEGTYSAEDETQVSELKEFDMFNPLLENEESVKGFKWKVVDRGTITNIPLSVLRDSAIDIIGIIGESFGKKAVKTENKVIFEEMRKGITPVDISTANELTNSLITDIDPAVEKEAVIVTNQDGLKKLATFKDEAGNKLLKSLGTDQGVKRYFDGILVEQFSNEELPNVEGKAPLFYGSFKQSIKFMDYQTMFIQSSEARFFNKAMLSIRGIVSFDVQTFATPTHQYKLLPLV